VIPNLKIRAVGYVNGDQWPDIIWQNQSTGLLSAWLMNDSQRVSEVPLSPDRVADPNWLIVGAPSIVSTWCRSEARDAGAYAPRAQRLS
jgi:hypothetical protein